MTGFLQQRETYMTDRHLGYIITLEKGIREDDAEKTIEALKMIKGVIGVSPIVATPESYCAAEQQVYQVYVKLLKFVKDMSPFKNYQNDRSK